MNGLAWMCLGGCIVLGIELTIVAVSGWLARSHEDALDSYFSGGGR